MNVASVSTRESVTSINSRDDAFQPEQNYQTQIQKIPINAVSRENNQTIKRLATALYCETL